MTLNQIIMKKNYILFAMFLFSFITNIYSQAMYDWAIHIGATSVDETRSIKTDNLGNVYVAGAFRGTPDFDTGPGIYTVTSAGGDDGFIAKYDALGNFLAVYTFSNNLNCKVYSIDIDNSGNILATGNFNGTVDFDPTATVYGLSAPGSYDLFVLKLNSNGTFAWAKKMGDASLDDCGLSIDTDASGDVFTTGYFKGSSIDFDPGTGVFPLSAGPWDDVFVLKLNSIGNFVWAFDIGTSSNSFDHGNSITTDASGNLFVGGFYQGTADFDPSPSTLTLTTTGSQNAFLSKYTSTGLLVWAKHIDGTGISEINDLKVNSSGDIFSVGSFTGSVDADPSIGTNLITSASSTNDIFFTRYNSLGNLIWANKIGSAGDDVALSMSNDATGLYFTGYYTSTVDFDPGTSTYTLSSLGNKDFFISKFDLNGNHLFSQSYGTNGSDDIAYGIATTSVNLIYLTGSYSGTVDFNPSSYASNTLSSYGNSDVFLLKLQPCVQTITLSASTTSICQGSSTSVTLSAIGTNTILWNTGATTSVIAVTPTITTNYLATGNFTTGCVNTQTLNVQVNICTRINDNKQSENQIRIYPNPNNGCFTLQTNQTGTVTFINALGQVIKTITVSNSFEKINIENLPSGIYYLKIGETISKINISN